MILSTSLIFSYDLEYQHLLRRMVLVRLWCQDSRHERNSSRLEEKPVVEYRLTCHHLP